MILSLADCKSCNLKSFKRTQIPIWVTLGLRDIAVFAFPWQMKRSHQITTLQDDLFSKFEVKAMPGFEKTYPGFEKTEMGHFQVFNQTNTVRLVSNFYLSRF
jgi:hypothetical protein